MNDIFELTEAEVDLVAGGAASAEPPTVCSWLGCYSYKPGAAYGSADLVADILRTVG